MPLAPAINVAVRRRALLHPSRNSSATYASAAAALGAAAAAAAAPRRLTYMYSPLLV